MNTILVIDDLKPVREQYSYDIHRKTNFDVLTAANGAEGLKIMAEDDIDVIILDLEMPEMDGISFLENLKNVHHDDVQVIVYTGKGNFESCVRAVKLGAYNFFDKNEVNLDQLIRFIENAIAHRQLLHENEKLRRITGKDSTLIGKSQAMKELKDLITKVAQVPSNVLIIGESGTGKELVAQEIHRNSQRSKMPFVALNCAAMPETLVESELFGFEKGAFSGATRTTKGKFEIANKGTLFLDEIGDMPISVQAKLLRVLENGKFSRLGGEGKTIEVDVRVIAATHRDIEKEIANGKFRQDLYYRICTHIIRVPPLRERLEDIELLAFYFMEETCERFGIRKKSMHPDVIEKLAAYGWEKNNVRELENIVERMIIQSNNSQILPEHIPQDVQDQNFVAHAFENKSYQELKREAEQHIIKKALERNDWHITNTTKELGLANHSNLLKIMKRLDIKKP